MNIFIMLLRAIEKIWAKINYCTWFKEKVFNKNFLYEKPFNSLNLD